MVPTRLSTSLFSAKAAILRLQRNVRDAADRIPAHLNRPPQPLPVLAARSITSLFPDAAAPENWYQRGKVENLRVAAAPLDGCFIPAHQLFSFWQQVGRPSRRRGFQIGRMLQEGCVIPSIGGGLCQLSNALYQVALASGCEIVERHAHSRVVPGSATSLGRDASVAWNYIDLRFRPPSTSNSVPH